MKRSPRRSGWVVWKSEKWRRRWQDAWDELTLFECTEPRRLRQAIRDTLRDAPRSGSPGKFTAEQVTRILAVACEPPPQSGRPITHWTHAELRDEVVKRGIVTSISVWQVGCYLVECCCSRTAARCGSIPPEKNPETFQRQVGDGSARRIKRRRVVMRNTARARSVWMRTPACKLWNVRCPTRMLAWERSPSMSLNTPAMARRPSSAIGTWSKARCLRRRSAPRRTEEDLIAHIEQTVATDSDVPGGFVMDCLNVHWSAGLVEWVAQRCEPNRPLGKKERRGVLKSQATRCEFLSDPSHRIRFVYLPAATAHG